MKKEKSLKLGLMILTILLLFGTSLAYSQINSLTVWENIADGTLTSTWSETTNANWKGQNVSGIWSYNCTSTTSLNWTYNATTKGDRWYQTWEVTSNDAETGIGSAQMKDATHYYAVLYYLSFNGSTPAIYIIYYNAGIVNYWHDTADQWDTNISNATDYTDLEKDFYSDYIRVKALWNWNEDTNNCTIRFKAWEPSGDEINYWLCDTVISRYSGDSSTNYYSGLVSDHRWDPTSTTTLYRRIMFWNLSYEMTPGLNHVINCPTYSAIDTFTDWADAEDFDDIWNATQIYKSYINSFDLTSFYDEDFYGDISNQNDTTYVFSMAVTEFRELVGLFFDPVPPDVPDNIIIMRMFLPIDGTSNESDYCLIRWDTDNDGTYESTDMAMWTNDTETIVYEGWTAVVEPGYYCTFGSGVSTGVFGGDIFRDDMYYCYTYVLNWDLMYNGSSGERIMDDECRMSMMFYDNDTDSISILQDFYPGDDDAHYMNTDGHNISDTPTWEDWNTSDFWTLFTIDTSITGEPLTDPEDPPTYDYGETTNYLVYDVLPLILALALIVVLFAMVMTGAGGIDDWIKLLVIVIIIIITINVILSL